jgi:Cu/Ag efflux pump CusA
MPRIPIVLAFVRWSRQHLWQTLVLAAGAGIVGFGGLATLAVFLMAMPGPSPSGEGSPAKLTLSAAYPGASAEEVERQVTIPLEVAVAGLPGLKRTSSRSYGGLAALDLEFVPGVALPKARQAAIERLEALKLPLGVNPLLGSTWTSERVVLRYTLHSPTNVLGQPIYSANDLRALEDWVLEREWRRLAGVMDAASSGGTIKRIEIQPDPERLRRFGITLRQLENAVVNSNGGGDFLIQGQVGKAVRVHGLIGDGFDPVNKARMMKTPQEAAAYLRAQEQTRLREIRAIVITSINKVPVKIDDVAQGGPLRQGALSTAGVIVSYQPRTSRVSRVQSRGATKAPSGASGKGAAWLVNKDAVCGFVLARPEADAAAITRDMLAKIKEWNKDATLLLPGVRIEPFPMSARETGTEFTMRATFPDQASLATMTPILQRVSEVVRGHAQVADVLTVAGQAEPGLDIVGSATADVFVALHPHATSAQQPKEKGPRSQAELEDALLLELERSFPGISWRLSHGVIAQAPFVLEKGEGLVKIFGPDLEHLEELAGKLRQKLRKIEGVSSVSLLTRGRKAQLEFVVNKEKCAHWGLTVADVNAVINAALGKQLGQMVEGEKMFDITVRWPQPFRLTDNKLLDIPVDVIQGAQVPQQLGPRLRLRDLVSPIDKNGRPDSKGTFERPHGHCIYREDGKRFVALVFRIRGREGAAVLTEARTRTAGLVSPPYRAEWQIK